MSRSNANYAKALLIAGLFAFSGIAIADPIPVELRETKNGWQLYRAGEPYFVRGAGGDGSLDRLAAAGANSVRTWGPEGAGDVLDAAHALGMTVTVGIWLGHERHGFDYDDPEQVAAQLDAARDVVLRFRDHPALLMWGIGNEMEGFDTGDNPAIWEAVNDVAAMAKKLDPHHPTMTVTAEIGGGRIEWLHRRCPAIDIHGINAYGGAASLPTRYADAGGTKPYVITEYGPIGPWEMPTTEWGAPYEQTSTEKAAFYRQTYQQAVLDNRRLALGSYAFLWSHKMETTPTWFGMLLPNGAKLGVVDAMTSLWGGSVPADLSPVIEPLVAESPVQLDPGDTFVASAVASDPEGDLIDYQWTLRSESGELTTGGDFRPTPTSLDSYLVSAEDGRAKFRMPQAPGAYRVYVYAYDSAGNAATANIPVRVKGEPRPVLPFAVYDEQLEGMPWVPSGWMGNTDALSLDGTHRDTVYEGEHSVRIRYEGTFGWAGIAWQNPPNNWGDQDGGFDLTGAAELEFWARGEYGGEKIAFGVGLVAADKPYADSAIVKSRDVELTSDWTRYSVNVRGEDLTSLKTGFVVTLEGRRTPVTFYLDRIRFVE